MNTWSFFPCNDVGPGYPNVALTLDELEAIRLADYQGLNQTDASYTMNISRATFGRIVAEARRKIAEALTTGKVIRIEGGVVEYPPYGSGNRGYGRHGKGPMGKGHGAKGPYGKGRHGNKTNGRR